MEPPAGLGGGPAKATSVAPATKVSAAIEIYLARIVRLLIPKNLCLASRSGRRSGRLFWPDGLELVSVRGHPGFQNRSVARSKWLQGAQEVHQIPGIGRLDHVGK